MHMHIYMPNLFYWRAMSEYRVFFFVFFFSFQMVNFKEHLPDLFGGLNQYPSIFLTCLQNKCFGNFARAAG